MDESCFDSAIRLKKKIILFSCAFIRLTTALSFFEVIVAHGDDGVSRFQHFSTQNPFGFGCYCEITLTYAQYCSVRLVALGLTFLIFLMVYLSTASVNVAIFHVRVFISGDYYDIRYTQQKTHV